MPIQLVTQALSSRTVREAIVKGGIRKFSIDSTTKVNDEKRGILELLWGGFKRLTGWILTNGFSFIKKALNFSFTKLAQLVVGTGTFLMNFNWNVSVKEANAMIKAQIDNFGGRIGGFLGRIAGYLVCGAVPAAGAFVFNEALGLHMLRELGEEAIGELCQELGSILLSTARVGFYTGFVWAYANIRAALKKSENFRKAFSVLVPGGAVFAELARKSDDKPWTINGAIQEGIEKLPDGFAENFVEEAYEEFGDSCQDAIYIIAGAADSFYLQQKIAANSQLGDETTVEILFNRDGNSNTNTGSNIGTGGVGGVGAGFS